MKHLLAVMFCLSLGMGQTREEKKAVLQEQSERAVRVIEGECITLQDWQDYVASCEPSPRDIEDSLHTLLSRIRVMESHTYRQNHFTPDDVREMMDFLRKPMGIKRTPTWEGFFDWLNKRKEKR